MRHVFETMGTVASLELPAGNSAALDGVKEIFAEIDSRFSLFRPESELSRVASGELPLTATSPQLRDSYARALQWRDATDGAFTPNRPDSVTDLNGIVKAEAIEAAGRALDAAGCHDWSLNVGGDILVSGVQPNGSPWTIGLVDPADRAELLCSVTLRGARRAIATSGSAERGDHIWRGGSIEPAPFIQFTVIADDIVTADVLATAIVAAGPDGLDDITDRWPIDVLSIDRSGKLLATPGFRGALNPEGEWAG